MWNVVKTGKAVVLPNSADVKSKGHGTGWSQGFYENICNVPKQQDKLLHREKCIHTVNRNHAETTHNQPFFMTNHFEILGQL